MPAGTAELVARVAARLVPETGRIARAITERVRAEIPEVQVIAEPAFWQAVEEGTQANLVVGLELLSGRRPLPRDAPLDATFVARLVAERGVSLASLLRAYRIGHRLAWEEWVHAVEALGVSSAERTELLATGSNILFEYVDRVAQLISEEYTHELDASIRDRADRRLRRVRDLVDGASVDTRELGYDLAHDHVAVVAVGDGVEAALQAAAGDLELRLLTVCPQPGTTWAWLGGRALADRAWRDLIVRTPPGEAVLGVGDAAAGQAGFRLSHQQAGDALLIAQHLSRSLCCFGDVAVEALALHHEPFVRQFVARELRGIDGGRAAKLRDTLRAYFASGHNAAAAAAALGVHDQTVAYRLRRIEECIGSQVAARRAELEVALRWERMLTQPASAGDAS